METESQYEHVTSAAEQKLQILSDGIKAVSTFITSFFMLATLAMLVIFSCREFSRDAIVVEPLLLPEKFAESGYTSQVVTRHFRDAVWKVTANGKSGHFDGFDTTPASKPDDLLIPGIGLSLQTAVRVIKDYLSIPQNRVGGEILIANGHLSFRPRYEKRITDTPHPAAEIGTQDLVSTEKLDNLLRKGARKVMVEYSNSQHQRKTGGKASPDQLIEWGNTLYTYRDYRGAIDKYERATHNVESDVAYTNWGLALAKERNFAGAKEKFEKALEIATKNDPQNAHTYLNNLGVALVSLANYDEAIVIFRDVLALNKNYAKAKCNWGWALAKNGQYKQSIKIYKQCLAVDPENYKAHNVLGNALRQLGDKLARKKKNKQAHKLYAEAFNNYKKALRIAPNYVPAYINWGLTLSRAGNILAAIAKYQKALEIDPRNATAYNNWSFMLQKQGNYDDAINKAGLAIHFDPELAAAYNTLGEALFRKKKPKTAIAKFAQAADLDEEKVAYYFWGQALEKQKAACEQIVDKYKAAIAKDDENSQSAKDALARVDTTCGMDT
ncbi:MAG: tetratricopeptide repeat protein [Methylococcaceae bacterium]